MDIHTATEQAYRNGYEAGKRDAEPKWILVTKRLPDKWMDWVNGEHMEPREFIVLIEDAEIPTVLCFDGNRFCDREHIEFYDVTHWMPLPNPPTE